MTPEIRQLIDRKSEYFELHRLDIITHTENNVSKNRISSLCRRAKVEYYKKTFLNLRNNSRSKWKLISSLTARGATHAQIKTIMYINIEYTSEADIANIFKIYFNTIASELNNSLPQIPNINPLHYVTRVEPATYLFRVSESELMRNINQLKPKKNSN